MGKFEYLSVLTSIIVGLAIANLLSGAARMIQLRLRVRPHATTYAWMVLMFLANLQIWWVAFERKDTATFSFFAFLLYLAIPVGAFLASTLLLPDLGDEDEVDLARNFDVNRPWFFGLLAAVPVVSLVEEAVRDQRLPMDEDAGFRVVFCALCVLAACVRSPRFHFWNAWLALGGFVAYVATLFLQLR